MTRLWLLLYTLVFAWSAINPADFLTWALEVSPAVICLLVLIATRKVFPLTGLVYSLLLLHCIILMVGGHYTYAEVPAFDWIRDSFGQTRNNYDKLAHFAQGFVPAMVAREVLLRFQVVNGRAWLHFLVVCFCLAVSAFYELLEWLVAVIVGGPAEAFLGTQGYVGDTQSVRARAMLGAITALLLLGRVHDRQLQQHGWLPYRTKRGV